MSDCMAGARTQDTCTRNMHTPLHTRACPRHPPHVTLKSLTAPPPPPLVPRHY